MQRACAITEDPWKTLYMGDGVSRCIGGGALDARTRRSVRSVFDRVRVRVEGKEKAVSRRDEEWRIGRCWPGAGE